MVINQIIEVQPWSISRPQLYGNWGLSVRPTNTVSGSIRPSL